MIKSKELKTKISHTHSLLLSTFALSRLYSLCTSHSFDQLVCACQANFDGPDPEGHMQPLDKIGKSLGSIDVISGAMEPKEFWKK